MLVSRAKNMENINDPKLLTSPNSVSISYTLEHFSFRLAQNQSIFKQPASYNTVFISIFLRNELNYMTVNRRI